MKSYVVFCNYGLEGWKPIIKTSDIDEALDKAVEWRGLGNPEVEIFEHIPTITIVSPKFEYKTQTDESEGKK